MTSTTERANPLRQWNPDWGGCSTARRPVAAVNTLFPRRSDFVKPLHPQTTPPKIGVRLGDQHVRVRLFTGPAHLPVPLRQSEPGATQARADHNAGASRHRWPPALLASSASRRRSSIGSSVRPPAERPAFRFPRIRTAAGGAADPETRFHSPRGFSSETLSSLLVANLAIRVVDDGRRLQRGQRSDLLSRLCMARSKRGAPRFVLPAGRARRANGHLQPPCFSRWLSGKGCRPERLIKFRNAAELHRL